MRAGQKCLFFLTVRKQVFVPRCFYRSKLEYERAVRCLERLFPGSKIRILRGAVRHHSIVVL
jgi:hypothetical protein